MYAMVSQGLSIFRNLKILWFVSEENTWTYILGIEVSSRLISNSYFFMSNSLILILLESVVMNRILE
jgi:hypothetical protein